LVIHHQVLYYSVTGWSLPYGYSPYSVVPPCDWLILNHMVIHHKVLYYHVTGWSLPYGYSLSGAVLSCDRLFPTIQRFTIKCCTIKYLADPYHMVIHHQVLYYHVMGWSPPYGDSPSSALLSCDKLIPTIWWFTIKSILSCELLTPHHMVIHHQVLYYHVTSWSQLYGDSPSSSLCSCDWLIPTIWWFTIKCCTMTWVPDLHYIIIHYRVLYYHGQMHSSVKMCAVNLAQTFLFSWSSSSIWWFISWWMSSWFSISFKVWNTVGLSMMNNYSTPTVTIFIMCSFLVQWVITGRDIP
jgi:hypothetical protein